MLLKMRKNTFPIVIIHACLLFLLIGNIFDVLMPSELNAANADISLTEEEKQWLREHPDVTFGSSDSFEPSVIKGRDGKLTGFPVDFLDRLNKKLGTDFKIEVGKWGDILQKAERGKIQGIGGMSKPQAEKRWLRTSLSHFTTYVTVYTKSDKAAEIQSPEALTGKKVAILRNDFSP